MSLTPKSRPRIRKVYIDESEALGEDEQIDETPIRMPQTPHASWLPAGRPRMRRVHIEASPRLRLRPPGRIISPRKLDARVVGSRNLDATMSRSRSMRSRSRRLPVPLMLGGLIGAVVVILALVAVFLISKNNPLAIASAPAQVPTTSNPTNSADTPGPKFDPNAPPVGLFDLSPGSPGVNRGQLNLPRGIAQDANGNFFVADTQNYRIQKFDKSGKFIVMFGSKGDQDAQFKPMSEQASGTGPGGVAVDKAGNVYVADTWNNRIQKFDNNGKLLTKWGGYINLADSSAAKDTGKDTKFWGPRGVAIGPDGNVYVTDTGNKRVLIFDPTGKPLGKIDSGMTKEKIDSKYTFDKPGELNEPIGIAVDGGGNIYVADTWNRRIQKFDKDRKPLARWAIPGNGWAPGPYLEPFLATDGAGNVYTTAPMSKTVLKFSPTGQLLGPTDKQGSSTLKTPTGITVGADGTVYIVDTVGNGVVNLGKIP